MAVLKYHYFRGHPGLMRPIHIARLGTFPTPYRARIIPDVHYTLCIILYTSGDPRFARELAVSVDSDIDIYICMYELMKGKEKQKARNACRQECFGPQRWKRYVGKPSSVPCLTLNKQPASSQT